MSKSLLSFFQPAFLICVVVLGAASGLKSYTIEKLGWYLTKLPLPLRNKLNEMDERKLMPYAVLDKGRITNSDVLESLGTDEYLQWQIEDPDEPADSPVRFCSLFVTYYTGNPDMVPHVPDECYVGGGNTRLSGETVRLDLGGSADGTLPESIGFQHVLFSHITGGLIPSEQRFSVQYLFKVNGEYSAGRTETRRILGKNFTGKYSYFCKVEWYFYGGDYSGRIYPDRKQTLEASRKLLPLVLRTLESDHWPDWKKANQKEN